jgi:hypothetical protein
MSTSSISNSAIQQFSNSANQQISKSASQQFFADEANLDSPKSRQQFSKSVSCKQIVLAILSCKQIHLQTSAA